MIRFVTFNIRCDYEQDGPNNFCFRQKLILKKLEEKKPDVICFQEVLPHVAAWLKHALKDYYVLGCGRSEDFQDEQMAIAFRPDRFDLISWETFWLSESGRPGSRYDGQSICPRTAAEALLYDREEKEIYRVFNTHLDHVSSDARKRGLGQILDRIEHPKTFPEAGVILAGDFNAEPGWPELSELWGRGKLTDAAAGLGGTFHDYGKLSRLEKIDYVCLAQSLKSAGAERWQDCEDGVYLSDHYPISVEIYRE